MSFLTKIKSKLKEFQNLILTALRNAKDFASKKKDTFERMSHIAIEKLDKNAEMSNLKKNEEIREKIVGFKVFKRKFGRILYKVASVVVFVLFIIFDIIRTLIVKNKKRSVIALICIFVIGLGMGFGFRLYSQTHVTVIKIDGHPVGITSVFKSSNDDLKRIEKRTIKVIKNDIIEDINTRTNINNLKITGLEQEVEQLDYQITQHKEYEKIIKRIKKLKKKPKKNKAKLKKLRADKKEFSKAIRKLDVSAQKKKIKALKKEIKAVKESNKKIVSERVKTEVVFTDVHYEKENLRKEDAPSVFIDGIIVENNKNILDKLPRFNVSNLKKALEDLNKIKYKTFAIYVDNVPATFLASKEDAHSVMEYFRNKIALESVSTISYFREHVLIKEKIEDIKKTQSVGDAVTTLLTQKPKLVSKTIKRTYTVSELAKKFKVSVDNLKKHNKNKKKFKKNSVVKYLKHVPYVHFYNEGIFSGSKSIPYKTIKVRKSSMFKGDVTVKKSGKNGKKFVIEKIFLLNGKEIKVNVLKSTVLRKPKNRVIYIGTKSRPAGYDGPSSYVDGNGVLSHPLPSLSVSSNFGEWRGYAHAGIDFQCPIGTPIYAAASGTVTQASYSGAYGNIVSISHGGGLSTRYAHMASMVVSVGQSVSRGQLIGFVGMTGNSTGPHLHFEVRVNGAVVNPWNYLS